MLFIEIYVQGDEDTFKTMALHPVRVYKRIVDHFHPILTLTHLRNFFHHIINLYLSNNFTMQDEGNAKVRSFEILMKQKNRRIFALIYRKSTYTDQYLHFHSQRQTSCGKSLVLYLLNNTFILVISLPKKEALAETR